MTALFLWTWLPNEKDSKVVFVNISEVHKGHVSPVLCLLVVVREIKIN